MKDQLPSNSDRPVHARDDLETDRSAAGLGALASRLDASGKTDQAIQYYQMAIEADPDFAEAYYNLGVIHSGLPDKAKTVHCFKRAIQIKPELAEPYVALGMVWCGLNRFEEAIVLLEQAVIINPGSAGAHYNLGLVLQHMGEFQRSMACFQKAQVCDPAFAPARWLSLLALPMIYDTAAEIEPRRQRFRVNLDRLITSIRLETPGQIDYALQGINTATNFYLQYQGRSDIELQVKYGQLVQAVMAARYPRWRRRPPMPPCKPGEKIRIGYVSSFMCDHTVGTFLSGWVENHGDDEFQVFCYHLGSKEDAVTAHFRKISHRFHHFPCNVEAAATRIAADRLHILIHTDVGMNPETLQLAALRLAPIQCKGWGHPVTTGLPTVDYYLSSDLMEPQNAHDDYSESLVRLPNLALCYKPPALPARPLTRRELGIPEDRFIYLSTQSIFKYLPQHDDIYPCIARQAPEACFVFIGHQSRFATRRFRHRLDRAFERHQLDADDYCHFTPRMDFDAFLSLNLSADVLLDTFEWSGGKTTLEAISCGLPVVTCPGRFMRGRHAYAMLKMMDIQETVARDTAGYVRIAIRLAKDRSYYRHAKQQIVDLRHKLYADREFIHALEQFYRRTVQQVRRAETSGGRH